MIDAKFNAPEAECGEWIGNYALRVWKQAEDTRAMAVGMFNECPVIAFPGETATDVEMRYRSLTDARRTAWDTTPEARQRRDESNRWKIDKKIEARAFIARMEKADLYDVETALEFVEGSSEAIGWDFTSDEAKLYVALLKGAGFEPNVNCGDDYKADDPDNAARWIIGQTITMPGHGIEQKFCKEWRERFTEKPVDA